MCRYFYLFDDEYCCTYLEDLYYNKITVFCHVWPPVGPTGDQNAVELETVDDPGEDEDQLK